MASRTPKRNQIKDINDLTPQHWIYIREYSAHGSRLQSYKYAYPEETENMSSEEIRNLAKGLEMNKVVKEQIVIYKQMHSSEAKLKFEAELTRAGATKSNLLFELSALKDVAISQNNHTAVARYMDLLCKMQGYYVVDKKPDNSKGKITFGSWSPADGIKPIDFTDVKPNENNKLNENNDTGE